MLDIRKLRDDPEEHARLLQIKGFDFDVGTFVGLEGRRRVLQQETEQLQAERNAKSKSIGKAKANGEDISPLVREVGDLGERLELAKSQFSELQQELQRFLSAVPNLPHESVPPGKDESENQELRRWGNLPSFNFSPQDHVDLTPQSMDFEAAVKISGSRFVVLKGQLARLHRALVQFMLDVHTNEHGYDEVYVPYIVNAESMFGTGQLPKFADDQFRIAQDHEVYLVPTAEVPVTNIYRDEIVPYEDLPLRHVCHTPCFRAEAGSHGRDTRGMIRQHQFDKVELVQLVHPSHSWDVLDELTGHAESILKKLELPYRAVVLCGGDLGFASAKTIDLEVWLPGQDKYREISSCSNFLDFQARRMQARFRDPQSGKPELLHTLNGSGLAVGRTLVALLENYQDGEGRVAIPDVLRGYLGNASLLELG